MKLSVRVGDVRERGGVGGRWSCVWDVVTKRTGGRPSSNFRFLRIWARLPPVPRRLCVESREIPEDESGTSTHHTKQDMCTLLLSRTMHRYITPYYAALNNRVQIPLVMEPKTNTLRKPHNRNPSENKTVHRRTRSDLPPYPW